MIDRLDAKAVEICIDHTGKLWVNVDGQCVLRIGHAEEVTLDMYGRNPKKLWPSKAKQ